MDYRGGEFIAILVNFHSISFGCVLFLHSFSPAQFAITIPNQLERNHTTTKKGRRPPQGRGQKQRQELDPDSQDRAEPHVCTMSAPLAEGPPTNLNQGTVDRGGGCRCDTSRKRARAEEVDRHRRTPARTDREAVP